MHVGARALREPLEEVLHQLALEIADARHVEPQIDDGVRPAAQIDRRDAERLVHRHHEVSRAVDTAPIAERPRDGLAERDAEIFHRVMLIHVEVAVGLHAQVECAVPREQLQHVIEETDAGADLIPSLAVEREPQHDVCFRRSTIDQGAAHKASSMTAMHRRVCSTMPVPMRMQPAQPGSVDRLRM